MPRGEQRQAGHEPNADVTMGLRPRGFGFIHTGEHHGEYLGVVLERERLESSLDASTET
jgi:hypothetical protein